MGLAPYTFSPSHGPQQSCQPGCHHEGMHLKVIPLFSECDLGWFLSKPKHVLGAQTPSPGNTESRCLPESRQQDHQPWGTTDELKIRFLPL